VALTFEARATAEPFRVWRSLWTLGLVACPVSYLSLVLVRLSPLSGALAAVGVALFLGVVARSAQGYRRRLSWWEASLAGLVMALLAWTLALGWGESEPSVAAFLAIATAAQVGFIWLFLPWLSCDLAGVEYEIWSGQQMAPRAVASARSSLSFLIFTSFVLFGLGALWSRGEIWVPSPAPWVMALALLVAGAMLQERLAYFARSAREGNLTLPRQAPGHWIALAAAALLLAGLLAACGPYRHAPPVPGQRTGSAQAEAPMAPPPSLVRLEQQLEEAAVSLAQGVNSLRQLPRTSIPLLLLLLLLLIATVLVWLFSRSRAARWLLWAVGWLIARTVAVWRWLRDLVLRIVTPAAIPIEELAPEPEWVRDPLFDIFAHPDVLAGLSPREVILRTYHLLLNVAAMLGFGRRPCETPLEYARTLQVGEGAARVALQDLTWGYAAVMYGGAGLPLPSPETVREAWSQVATALVAQVSEEEVAARREAYLRG
jgi:hypothetical protein